MAIQYSQVANPSMVSKDTNFKINDAQLPSRSKAQVQMQVLQAPNQSALQARMNTPKPQMRNILDHKIKYEEDCCCEDGSLDNIAYRNPQTQFNKSNKATIATLQDVKLNKGTSKLNYQTQKALDMIKKMEDMEAKYSNDYSMEDDQSMSEDD